MPASFTPNLNPFAAKSIFDSVRDFHPETRKASTNYAQGALTVNAGNLYAAIQGGSGVSSSSGATAPTHTSGTATDGTVSWLFLSPYPVVDGSLTSNLYLTFGRNDGDQWPDEGTPPAPIQTQSEWTEVLSNIVFGLKVNGSDISLGFAKNEWVSAVHAQYNPEVAFNANIVVLSGQNLYKCIDNNGGATSTVAPSGTSTTLTVESDGYIWKYLGTVSPNNQFRFATPNFLPFPDVLPVVNSVQGAVSSFNYFKKTAADFADTDTIQVEFIGSGTGLSAALRTTEASGVVTVNGIYATNPGSNYNQETFVIVSDESATGAGATLTAEITAGGISGITVNSQGADYASTPTVIILGDGVGATATAVESAGAVVSINVTAAGSGYTWAKALVIPGTKGAAARAILAPPGGHGFNLEAEIGASSILISKNVEIGNPNIPLDSGLVDGTFRQISLVSGVIVNQRNAPSFIGPAHANYTQDNQVKYLRGGTVLFENNVQAIVHTNAQEEVVKIAMNINAV